MQLVQIAVLPSQDINGNFTYALVGIDTSGGVWTRNGLNNSWVRDTAIFYDEQ